jgi:curved DNA-binding protein CbpA
MYNYNMGNASAKQQSFQAYQQYYQQGAGPGGRGGPGGPGGQEAESLDLSSLDPYKILNVPKNFTWQQLKDAYKQAAFKTHPDKEGGNKLAFDFVTNCFKTLAEEYKGRSSDKTHHDLKKDSNEYFEKIVNNNVPHPAAVVGGNEPFQKRFNKAFEECRYVDESLSHGYGEMMAKSTGVREDISVENVFASKDKVDNSTFNEIFAKKVPVSKEIVKYKEPEPMLMAKALKFTEIGGKRPDDFSSSVENKSLVYTDYMKAHSGMRLADPDAIKGKKDFKSIEDYEKYREKKTNRGLTEKERKFIEEKKKKEEQEEFNRQERIRLQNLAIQRAHDKANRILLQ